MEISNQTQRTACGGILAAAGWSAKQPSFADSQWFAQFADGMQSKKESRSELGGVFRLADRCFVPFR